MAAAIPLPSFDAPYAPDDGKLIRRFIAETRLDGAAEARIDARATAYIEAIRAQSGLVGGLEDFLREYGLSTPEGLALMALAEALLRVPDAATQDRLIEDKLAGTDWGEHASHADTWFVSASTWALGLSSRIVQPGETPDGVLASLVKRLGQPAVRTAIRQAMRVLGHHFVLGETIEEAIRRARISEARGFRHSYDMLGEGARTQADAERYFESYAAAIAAIGKSASDRPLPDRPGISVKLSALHPRYEAVKRERVMRELVPRLLDLAREAKRHDLAFTVDAEEADRLEISLAVIAAAFADPSLAGWDGFGLAVQACQKRAAAVVDWVAELARSLDRRMMVRLVKGAYWDTEIKRAQERGLADYPVFTRKAATDEVLSCLRQAPARRPATPLPAIREPQRADGGDRRRNGRRPDRVRVPTSAWNGRGTLCGSRQGHGHPLPHLCTGRRSPGPARLSRPPHPRERRQFILRSDCRRSFRADSDPARPPVDAARGRKSSEALSHSSAGEHLRAPAEFERHGVRRRA